MNSRSKRETIVDAKHMEVDGGSRSPVTIEREQQSRFRTEMTISAQYLRETLLWRFDVAGLLASKN